MAVASRTVARDLILAPLKVIVDAQSLTAIYDDTEKEPPKSGTAEWVRVSVRHRRGARVTLGRSDGSAKHRQSGFVFVDIFTPKDDGLVRSDLLSNLFADSFRTSGGTVWYRDVSEVEFGNDGNWFRSDVIAEFEYDLIR